MKKVILSISILSLLSFTFIKDVETEKVETVSLIEFAEDSYSHLGAKELFFKPYKYALNGYYKLLAKDKLRNTDYLTIVDFSKSCNEKRMFVIDTKTWQVVHESLVAHGMSTGEEYAHDFSNIESSHQSSLGFYVTGEIYDGRHDKSLKLDGQESFNDNARERGVVIHAADYVSSEYVKSNGRLGRSYGCPALPHEGYEDVVDKIKNGSCFFIYYPDKDYLKKSTFLKGMQESKVDCDGTLISS